MGLCLAWMIGCGGVFEGQSGPQAQDDGALSNHPDTAGALDTGPGRDTADSTEPSGPPHERVDCEGLVEALPVGTCEELALAEYGTYCLLEDLSCEGVSWSRPQTFRGTFYGNGHRISHDAEALFNALLDAEVRDLEVTGSGRCAVAVTASHSLLDNLSVTGAYSEAGVVCSLSGASTLSRLTADVVSDGAGVVSVLADSRLSGATVITTVDGHNYAGGVVGLAIGAHIEDVVATVAVDGFNYSGGLVAKVDSESTIQRCAVHGSVHGATDYVGGIAGSLHDSVLTESYSSAMVSGSAGAVGGLIGVVTGASVLDSYAHGDATGAFYVGGLIGALYSGSVERSYSAGAVSWTTSGGPFAGNATGGAVAESYWNMETTGLTTSPVSIGLNTAQMVSASTFATWDFDHLWTIDDGHSYPCLRWSSEECVRP